MHFAMNYRPTIDFHAPPAAAVSSTSGQLKSTDKDHSRTKRQEKLRAAAKSSPCDANDLRRRLYLVVAQQNAIEEQKDRARRKAEAKKAQEAKARVAEEKRAAKASSTSSSTVVSLSKHNKSKSLNAAASLPRTTATNATAHTKSHSSSTKKLTTMPRPFSTAPYVPREAASQFEKTATSELMVDSSEAALKRTMSHRDHREEPTGGHGNKNRFALPRRRTGGGGAAAGPRPTSMGDILEFGRDRLTTRAGPHADEDSSVDSLSASHRSHYHHTTTAAAQEPRVDWTQSDENDHQKPRSMMRSPLLRKVESIWTLNGRLGGSGSGTRPANKTTNIVDDVVSEEGDEEEGSGGKSSHSSSSSRAKFGFLGKLKS